MRKEPPSEANSANGQLSIISGSFPSTIDCHCMGNAIRYRQRTFTNHMGHKVTRVFYRCENCLSRIYIDYIPELDKAVVNVFDLLKNYR